MEEFFTNYEFTVKGISAIATSIGVIISLVTSFISVVLYLRIGKPDIKGLAQLEIDFGSDFIDGGRVVRMNTQLVSSISFLSSLTNEKLNIKFSVYNNGKMPISVGFIEIHINGFDTKFVSTESEIIKLGDVADYRIRMDSFIKDLVVGKSYKFTISAGGKLFEFKIDEVLKAYINQCKNLI